MPGRGHNSHQKPRGVDVTAEEVFAFVQRAERLHEERKALGADLAELFSEARGQGYDVATLKRIIQRRSKDEADVVEADELLSVYEAAILRASRAHVREG